ncbi:MAG: PLP-dependent aminotransferase family protein [Deferribacterales bacterium]
MSRVKGDFRYRQVMDVIVNMMKSGVLNPGDKVPSLRKISEEQGVSISTAMQAYMELESVGMLEARPQSGFYVASGTSVPREAVTTSRPLDQPTQVKKSDLIQTILYAITDPDIVPLGCAIPSTDLLPHKELTSIMRRILSDDTEARVEYGDVKGNKFFRQQLAHYMNANGNSVSSEQLIVTNGASEAMTMALRALTRPGDLVIMESPSYFGFMHLLETAKIYALELPTSPIGGILMNDFRNALDRYDVKAVLVQPNHGNPMGQVYPDDIREEMVNLCNKKDVPIIEDDINGDFTFSGRRYGNLKKYDKNGNVIHISSFSKSLAPGFRVGWVEPGKYHEEILRQKIAGTMASNDIMQLTLAHYLASGKMPRHLRRMNSNFKAQVETYTYHILKNFPEGTRVTRPKGGFVLWAEMPEQVDTLDMYPRALDEKISFSPGGIFTSQQKYNNCMRINCGFPWDARMENSIIRLGELAKEYI